MKTIKCDYWNHPELSEKIIEVIQDKRSKVKDDIYSLDCVPKMRKPYFWEFWKFNEYKQECLRILREVQNEIEG